MAAATVEQGVHMPTEIMMVGVDELLPYARNSKTHPAAQIEALAGNMQRVGFTNPLLIADGTIIAGHGRLLAAKKLGLKRVPCIDLSHLSEDERRAQVIWDNRSPDMHGAAWDLEMLKLETDELRADGFDLEQFTGFDEGTLADMLRDLEEPPKGGGDPDAAPAKPEEPATVLGDVWVCGAHRIMCGSSTEHEAWDVLMRGELADVVWTDPPYNVDIGEKNRQLDKADGGNRAKTGGIENDKMSNAEFRAFLLGMFQSVFEVMKPGAPIYVAHADRESEAFCGTFREAGFKQQSILVWRKNQMVLSRTDYQSLHEPILYGWKPGSAHRWYGGRKNTTVAEMGDGGPFTRLADGRWQIKVGDSVLVVDGAAAVEEHPGSVIFEAKPAKSDLHPTQKPVNLVERQLRNSARPGDIVVDAFGGSGTTLIAADRLGLCARIMELDPGFVDVIVRRWEMLTGRRAQHAVTGEPFPREGEPRAASPAPAPEKFPPDGGNDVF